MMRNPRGFLQMVAAIVLPIMLVVGAAGAIAPQAAQAAMPPTVGSVSPSSGNAGTLVIIHGSGLMGLKAVDFGTTPAKFYFSLFGMVITFAPSGATGRVPVTVTSAVGTSLASESATFQYPPQCACGTLPTVSSVAPASGPTPGGTMVTITGNQLFGATAVDFGTVPATGVMVMSATSVMAVSPAGVGTVDVTVQTPNGTSPVSAADKFTYESTACPAGLSSCSGPVPLTSDCATIGAYCSTNPDSVPGTTPNPDMNVVSDSSGSTYVPPGTSTKMTYGPLSVPAATSSAMGQDWNFPKTNLAMPCTNCYITSLVADLTYTNGTEATLASGAWFHHAVFLDTAKTDATCPSAVWNLYGVKGERFFASGDEKTPMVLPPGYAWYVGANDTWDMIYMLMNMNTAAINVDITLTATWVPATQGTSLTPVHPFWLDIDQCGTSQLNETSAGYNVFSYTWNVNTPGRLVGLGGHVHDGGINLVVQDDTQNNLLLCNSVAGYVQAPPPMQGMAAMVSNGVGQYVIATMSGCGGGWGTTPPIATLNAGDQVSIHAVYDNALDPGSDTQGVMGIVIGFVAETGSTPGGTTGS